MRFLTALLFLLSSITADATTLSLTSAGPNSASLTASTLSLCSAVDDNTAQSTITCTTGSTVPAGNSIVVIGGNFSGFGFDSVSDGTANSYTIEQTTASTFSIAIAWVLNPVQVNSGSTITMHWPTFTSVRRWIQVFSVGKTLTAGTGAGANGTSTTPSCTAGGGIYGFGGAWSAGFSDTLVQPSGWTAGLTGNENLGSEIATGYNAAGLTTYNPTGFSNQVWVCRVKSFS